MVLHQCNALVAHSILFLVNLAQSLLLLATIIAHGLSAPLAVVFENHAYAAKSFAAKHAKARVHLGHRVNVKYLRQTVLHLHVLALRKDYVELTGDRSHPPFGMALVTVRTALAFGLCRGAERLFKGCLISVRRV